MPRFEVWRDRAGVPLIKASTLIDAIFGLGQVHARDRLLQMQTMRILGEGRAAELLADDPLLLDYDVKLRSLGMAEDARAQTEKLDPELARLLDAYTEGVNAGTFGPKGPRRPLEMRLVGLTADRWEAWHTLLTLKVTAYVGLAEIQEDAERFIIDAVRKGADVDKLRELFSPYLDGLDVDLVRSVSEERPVAPRPALADELAGSGSNAFAVAGSHSVSGRALLANDPHLTVNRLPAIWMEAMVQAGERRVMGSTLPGTPAFISARTDDLAWGVTYSMGDVIDFFVEEVEGTKVRRGDGWEALEILRETFGRRGAEPVERTIRRTPRGVVEGDGDGRHLALAWAGRKGAGVPTFRAFAGLFDARTVGEAMELVRQTDVPPLNWVMADREGNVAWQLGGRYPVRRDGWSGLYPMPGWDPANDWRGWRSPEGLPRVVNPDRGVVISANDNRNDPDQPPYISFPHSDCRARRIAKLLRPPGKIHLDMLRIAQLDTRSLQAERLLKGLLPLLPDSEEAAALARWDYRYIPATREPTLFENLWRELVLTVFGDGGLDRQWLAGRLDEGSLHAFLFGQLDDILLKKDSLWLPASQREATIRAAAERAFAEPSPLWAQRARVPYGHLLLGGQLPRFLGFDRGPVPIAGGRASPRQGSIYRRAGRTHVIAPSYRFLAEMGPEPTIESCLPGGPSEHRFSRHYASELRAWQDGRYKTVSFDGELKLDPRFP